MTASWPWGRCACVCVCVHACVCPCMCGAWVVVCTSFRCSDAGSTNKRGKWGKDGQREDSEKGRYERGYLERERERDFCPIDHLRGIQPREAIRLHTRCGGVVGVVDFGEQGGGVEAGEGGGVPSSPDSHTDTHFSQTKNRVRGTGYLHTYVRL